MGREEQIEEREVLDSIFPDEITGEAIRAVSFPLVSSLHYYCLSFSLLPHKNHRRPSPILL